MIELPGHPWFLGCQFHPSSSQNRFSPILCSPGSSPLRIEGRPARRGKSGPGRPASPSLEAWLSSRCQSREHRIRCRDPEGGQREAVLHRRPCVIESEHHCLRMAEAVAAVAARLDIRLIFKASYDKANRTSSSSFRGPGADEGLRYWRRCARRADCRY